MQSGPNFAVYIAASRSRTIYIGVTNNLRRRMLEHKCKLHSGFSSQNDCDRLVWFANFEYIDNAISMEKKLKGWLRTRKAALIEENNPTLQDLSEGWYTQEQLEKFGTDQQLTIPKLKSPSP